MNAGSAPKESRFTDRIFCVSSFRYCAIAEEEGVESFSGLGAFTLRKRREEGRAEGALFLCSQLVRNDPKSRYRGLLMAAHPLFPLLEQSEQSVSRSVHALK